MSQAKGIFQKDSNPDLLKLPWFEENENKTKHTQEYRQLFAESLIQDTKLQITVTLQNAWKTLLCGR